MANWVNADPNSTVDWVNADPNSTVNWPLIPERTVGLTGTDLTHGHVVANVTSGDVTALSDTGGYWDAPTAARADINFVAVYANGTRMSCTASTPEEHQVKVEPTNGSGGVMRITFHEDTGPISGDYFIVEYQKP